MNQGSVDSEDWQAAKLIREILKCEVAPVLPCCFIECHRRCLLIIIISQKSRFTVNYYPYPPLLTISI